MKKRFVFMLIFTVILNSSVAFSDTTKSKDKTKTEEKAPEVKELNISAEAAILIDAKTGEILYEKEASKNMYPASTTKILTAIIAIENSDLKEKVIIDEETVASAEGTRLNLVAGEVFIMEDLINALLVSSANDAATAIASHISGTVENFATLMNQEAKKMGAKNSNFINPSGLPNDSHVSTAYDLAVIAKYAMKNDIFREIVSKSTYEIKPTNKHLKTRKLKNSNKLLHSDETIQVDGKTTSIKYDGVLGIKTGYTKAAQQCLVSGVNNSGQEYITVVLHSVGKNIYIDTHKLFNYSSKSSSPTLLARKNEFIDNIPIKGASTQFITAVFEKDFNIRPTGEDISNIIREFKPIPNLKLPIDKGQVIGKVNFKNGDQVVGSVNAISSIKIINHSSKIYSITDYLKTKWWFWALVSLIILRVIIGIRRIRHRMNMLKRKRKGQAIK